VGSEAAFEELGDAICRTHGGEPRFVESVPIREVFKGQTVWEGVVHVFDLTGHRAASRAYAWSQKVEGTVKGKFVVVLHQGPVYSPLTAVRAAIQEAKEPRS
jgi:hypothetical protein